MNLPPFLFFLAVFFALAVFAITVFLTAFAASLQLEIRGFLCGFKRLDWRMLVNTTSKLETQMAAAKAGLARAALFFRFRHVKMLLL